MKIIWSIRASISYQKTIDFILEKWPIEIAENLETKIDELFNNLVQNKHFCPPSNNNPKIRRCVVSKQTSLIYEVGKNSIEILLFIDNRSDHKY
ncbi:MAG: hypothetical protein GQ574_22510 [Crocinitomix sp.]|nr:hypothetical protein [Crocinitomix sp.]